MITHASRWKERWREIYSQIDKQSDTNIQFPDMQTETKTVKQQAYR